MENHVNQIKAEKLELHYFFYNESTHVMNAFDRNKCEHHLLVIIKEVSDLLDLKLDVESEAIREGGIKEIKRIISKCKPYLVEVAIRIIASLMANYLMLDNELEELQKEDLRLSIEEHKYKITKLRQELGNTEIQNSENIVAQAVCLLSQDSSIKRQKSNYYKVLRDNTTISKCSFSGLDINNNLTKFNLYVNRQDFYKYICQSDNLPTIVDDNAKIEIVSPVLKNGNYSWKGIYNGEVISFKLNDKTFKQDIINKKIVFSNGFIITSVLQIKRKYNQYDNEERSYIVSVVIDYYEASISTIQTIQGKKYRKYKNSNNEQLSLLDDDNFYKE